MSSEASKISEDSAPKNQPRYHDKKGGDSNSDSTPVSNHRGDGEGSSNFYLVNVKEGGDDERADNSWSSLLGKDDPEDISFDKLCHEVEHFLSTLAKDKLCESPILDIPNHVSNFLEKMNSNIDDYEKENDSSDPTFRKFGVNQKQDDQFLSAINLLSRLTESIVKFKSQPCPWVLLNEATSVHQRAMVFMEEEFRYILAEAAATAEETEYNQDQTSEGEGRNESWIEDQAHLERKFSFPYYSEQDVSIIRSIARIMISSGHEVECLSVFVENRRGAFQEEINKKHGFGKISMDEVQKMPWDQLEAEVANCNRALRHLLDHLLKGERKFYESVLEFVFFCEGDVFRNGEVDNDENQSKRGQPCNYSKSKILFSDLTRSVLSPFIDFAHSIAMTKRSTEKLFKFLDMYEALRDVEPEINADSCTGEMIDELKTELMEARNKLGEAVVVIFSELEMSIKSDNTKQPIPSGAVHPLIRYTMNYVKYACEYKDTLEQVFLYHHPNNKNEITANNDNNKEGKLQKSILQVVDHNNHSMTPFTAQLMRILDLLDTNLDAKSKLYKDVALRYVFLMNNGRYMLQKIRGSPEIHQVVRDPWCRRRSSDMRQYHKGYQREAWSKVLQCLNPEGLQIKGKLDKPVLKDRFKNFNQQFDEIHKTQSTWVVSDEQLQSELRVSISAVMIPAYRGFLARYGQIFTPGRQYEKYIKYQPEDIENAIDELFDGNPTSMARRRS